MQEQQRQAHTQQKQAMLDLAAHQAEDRAAMQDLMRRAAGGPTSGEGGAGTQGPEAEADRPLPLSLQKMTPGDEAFLKVFEGTVEPCGWPHAQWAMRLLPLLTEEALSTAHGLPAAICSSYSELSQALVDRWARGPLPWPISCWTPQATPGSKQCPAGGGGGCPGGLPRDSRVITLADDHIALPSFSREERGGGPSPHFQPVPAARQPPEGSRVNLLPSYWPPVLQLHTNPPWVYRANPVGVLELGQVVRVATVSAPGRDLGGRYRTPVRVQGGLLQALLDLGSIQTLIHQSLVQAQGTVGSIMGECMCTLF